jgi:hypothetical protein
MDEEITAVDEALGMALDFDVLRGGAWVGVFQRGSTLHVASSFGFQFALPRTIRLPVVRYLDPDRLVVVDAKAAPGVYSGFVMSVSGTMLHAFHAGHGVEDVVVLNELIAITYFDQGVQSGVPPSEQGIAFFDRDGQYYGGYRSLYGSTAANIVDCYAACRVDHHTIAFTSYSGFPLVLASPMSREHVSRPLPTELHGASALSLRNETAIFFAPYQKKGALLAWQEGYQPREVGRHPGPLRGLEFGRFLSTGRHGFTVLRCDL